MNSILSIVCLKLRFVGYMYLYLSVAQTWHDVTIDT